MATLLLVGMALMVSPNTAVAQEWRSGSTLAEVDWPTSAYDWADDDLGGPRQTSLAQAASDLGQHCGAAREFFAWNLQTEDDPEGVWLNVLTRYETAGWTLTRPVVADPTVYLATRGATQLAVRLYAIPEQDALALFSCALQAEPVTAAAVADATFADRSARAKQSEVPVVAGFGWAALAMALGGLLLELWQRRRVLASAKWEEVAARIAESSIKKTTRTNANDDEFTNYTPLVRYQYRYADVAYEGKRLRFGSSDTEEQDDAEALIARFPPGATVMARVNPAK
ncbi:MAG TPA: DUF3592 domain-containing protein, partial [Devosia sp.]|nr:DUF3592 domain-containing protein [Devosia sp.]